MFAVDSKVQKFEKYLMCVLLSSWFIKKNTNHIMSNKSVFSQLLKGEYYQQNGQNIFVHMDKDKEPSSIYK